MIQPQHLRNAQEARLLTAISFHYVKDRLIYLEKELQSLAAFPVMRCDIVLFTNATDAAQQDSIRQAFGRAGLEGARAPRLVVEVNLSHPYNLTWAHKRLIPNAFLAPDSPYSHFIYLEDDLQLTFENFAYFLAAREILRPYSNLVPGFLRTEWSARRECLVSSDVSAPIRLPEHCFITAGDCAFLAADNPYWAGFILDQELGQEYAASRSFDFRRSRSVSYEMRYYGVRERAAMGLTFEKPPVPFAYRVVVPVSITARAAPPYVLLPHLPNTYADNPTHHLGKIALSELFAGHFDAGKEVVGSVFNSPKQRRFRFRNRVVQSWRAMCREIWLNLMDALRHVKRSIFGPASPKRG